MEIILSLRGYERSRRTRQDSVHMPLAVDSGSRELGDGLCRVRVHSREKDGAVYGEAEFTFLRPTACASAVAVELAAENWSRENFVFMPGAVYGGNRFSCQKLAYPPYAVIPEEEAVTAEPVVTDIPRLPKEGDGQIQLRSGDMTTPAVGYYDPRAREGVLLYTRHLVHGDYTGVEIWERGDRASLAVTAPAVREEKKYFFGDLPDGSGFYPTMDMPSDDTGRWFFAGDQVTLPFCVYRFRAEALSGFFAGFHRMRACLETGTPACAVPFGKAYETVKKKFQRENYAEDERYFTVGTDRSIPQQNWQAGWTGGGINIHSFLVEDKGEANRRAQETFRFIFDRLQMENGWVCAMYANGVYYGDAFDLEKPSDVLLIRKNADMLYFLLKEYTVCRKELSGYEGNLRRLCGAFVRLYRKYGQIGQFIHTKTDTIAIGNSACGAIACGALALAYDVLGDEAYLETAEGLGEAYERDCLDRGILNGCPGEICQAPDSEAAFGMLEGYVQLYETTGKERWLDCARRAADIAMTWVMSYDFDFPRESTAAKRGTHTLGTVFANAQNKHSAPGICTLSGNSLLKLYRFTGEEAYLKGLQNIARALTQFVSLEERPVYTLAGKYLPAGYMNERVQTSDWEGKTTIGEFLCGSNWPEVCVLLTYVEVPGVYVNQKTGLAAALDSLDCGIAEENGQRKLWVKNPTAYDTTVTVLIDDGEELGAVYFDKMKKLPLKAGETVNISLRY